MSRSLGLAAYRALSRRSSARQYTPHTDRPDGELLWVNAATRDSRLAVEDFAHRISATRHGLHVLVTLPEETPPETALSHNASEKHVVFDVAPSEHPEAVDAFWNHWRPNMGIWTHGNLRPNLILEAHDHDCPMVLIDAEVEYIENRRYRVLPDLSRQILDPYIAFFASTSAASQRLGALGVNRSRIEVTPPLQAGGQALPCSDSDLDDLSETLAGRPVWLACDLPTEELSAVLEAHRRALRMSHRLLLILHPVEQVDQDLISDRVQAAGFRLSDWTAGDEPDDATQVLLTSDYRDLGLFYRVAPVSFMGGSLTQGHSGRNPFEAAALGSAVLYGPNVRAYMPFYTRLAKAGAARIVKDEDTLASAVTRLIAPDEAAAMAHAGWDVVSQGAALTDRLVELVQCVLDGDMEAVNAPA